MRNSTFRALLSSAIFLLVSASLSGQCYYTITLSDTHQDGWDGASIDILQNQSIVSNDLTLYPGDDTSVSIWFEQGDSITVVLNSGGLHPEEVTYEITDNNGAVVGSGDGYTGISTPIIVDCYTCPHPKNPVRNFVSDTSATLSWDSEAKAIGYDYELSYNGGEQSGTVVQSGSLLDTSVTLIGLADNTNYRFSVRSDCEDHQSHYYDNSSSQFETECTSLVSFTEDFDGPVNVYGMPKCWVSLQTSVYLDEESPRSGATALRMRGVASDWSGYNPAYVTLPLLSNLTEETHRLRFWMMGEGATISVGTIQEGQSTWEVAPLDTFTGTAEYREYQVNFPADVGDYVVIKYMISGGYSNPTAYIDDVSWLPFSSCDEPLSITVDSVSATAARLSWANTAKTTQWQVATVPTGGTLSNAQLLMATVHENFALTGLQNDMTYDVYVRSICAPGDTSAWSEKITFEKLHGSFDAIYEPFEETVSTTGLPDYWQSFVSNGGEVWVRGTQSNPSNYR